MSTANPVKHKKSCCWANAQQQLEKINDYLVDQRRTVVNPITRGGQSVWASMCGSLALAPYTTIYSAVAIRLKNEKSEILARNSRILSHILHIHIRDPNVNIGPAGIQHPNSGPIAVLSRSGVQERIEAITFEIKTAPIGSSVSANAVKTGEFHNVAGAVLDSTTSNTEPDSATSGGRECGIV